MTSNILEKRYFVLGAARSGISAARMLKNHGAKVFLSEKKLIPFDVKNILIKEHIGFEENGHDIQNLCKNFDVLVVSPGIPLTADCIMQAQAHGLSVISEIECALSFVPLKTHLIGITGTNGKSTTTHYLAHLLNTDHIKSYACGNIGTPLSSIVHAENLDVIPRLDRGIQFSSYEALSIELSSYQLELGIPKRFCATIFLNLQNDHLERHKNIESYLRAKWNLVLATKDNGICIIDKTTFEYAQNLNLPLPRCKIEFCDNPNVEIKTPCLIGEHNAKNIFAASLAAMHVGVTQKTIKTEWENSTSHYTSLPHRLEIIKTQTNKQFINDSKATNVESTLVALKSLSQPLHLLLGGVPKGDSYLPISQFLGKNVVRIYPFGKAANKICEELHEFGSYLETPSHDMISASQKAFANSRMNDTILLSPACSSFDEFNNFEHRGDVFRNWAISTFEG